MGECSDGSLLLVAQSRLLTSRVGVVDREGLRLEESPPSTPGPGGIRTWRALTVVAIATLFPATRYDRKEWKRRKRPRPPEVQTSGPARSDTTPRLQRSARKRALLEKGNRRTWQIRAFCARLSEDPRGCTAQQSTWTARGPVALPHPTFAFPASSMGFGELAGKTFSSSYKCPPAGKSQSRGAGQNLGNAGRRCPGVTESTPRCTRNIHHWSRFGQLRWGERHRASMIAQAAKSGPLLDA